MTPDSYESRLLPTMGAHITAFLTGYEDKLDTPQFDDSAIKILNERYFIKNDAGEVIETPTQLLARVALGVQYKDLTNTDVDDLDIESIYETAFEYFNMMATLSFLPGSPTLMNAGTPLGQMSACFVVPVGDSMPDIMDAVKSVALIHQSGGGTGMDFSGLRPKGSPVKSTQGVASGPISFMKVFDATTEQIKQGGKRRGANMGMLRIDHPDIREFITCKDDDKSLQNFNISVAVTDDFMEALEGRGFNEKDYSGGHLYSIKDPKNGEHLEAEDARVIWDMIVKHAYNTGDPGIIFIDRVNAYNPFDIDKYPSHIMHATNPCGEQPLEAYEACNLGSVNLVKFLRDTPDGVVFDYVLMERAVYLATRLLDDVVENSIFPMEEISEAVRRNRKIGLGVMGWADSLLAMGIPYGSPESLKLAEEVMGFIDGASENASLLLADLRGSFPAINESLYTKQMRNAARTTIAPTGTISMLANGTSSGVEPVFAFTYTKKVMDGKLFNYVHPEIEKQMLDPDSTEKPRWWDEFLETGAFPDVVKRAFPQFVGAMDVTPEQHVLMQAAFQAHINNAVSKTINLPNEATVEDVDAIYRLAYDTGCKGTTIYRDGSKSDQVLFTGSKSENSTASDDGVIIVKDEEAFALVTSALDHPEAYELVPTEEYERLVDNASHKMAARPEVMLGLTVKTDTPCGHLYVTISEDEDGRPFEVFCKLGKSGACAGAVQETMGRMVSQHLRSGGDMDRVVKQLRGASCGQSVGMGPKRVTSCIDAIGQVLQRYADGEFHNAFVMPEFSTAVDEPVDKPVDIPLSDGPGAMLMKEHVDTSAAPVRRKTQHGACPECGGPMEHEGGCAVCRSCGNSKCA